MLNILTSLENISPYLLGIGGTSLTFVFYAIEFPCNFHNDTSKIKGLINYAYLFTYLKPMLNVMHFLLLCLRLSIVLEIKKINFLMTFWKKFIKFYIKKDVYINS